MESNFLAIRWAQKSMRMEGFHLHRLLEFGPNFMMINCPLKPIPMESVRGYRASITKFLAEIKRPNMYRRKFFVDVGFLWQESISEQAIALMETFNWRLCNRIFLLLYHCIYWKLLNSSEFDTWNYFYWIPIIVIYIGFVGLLWAIIILLHLSLLTHWASFTHV